MTNLLSLRAARVLGFLGGALLSATLALAQTTDPIPELTYPPLDDITERTVVSEHRTLTYPPIREADILWEKRLWRVIDTREKMNLPFVAPGAPLFTIFSEAALAGDLTVYSTVNDQFTIPLSLTDVESILMRKDTILLWDPEDYTEQGREVRTELNWEDVRRYRLKESWFFDTRTSTLRVRILGIAPLIDVLDEDGNFRYEKPLFWVHYPSARALLAGRKAPLHGDNHATTLSWEDLFEMRYFSSFIMKENNLHDMRLQDYLTGTELLLHAQKIEDDLFNREQDLWSW